jgi:Flp pilus assembly protein TadD
MPGGRAKWFLLLDITILVFACPGLVLPQTAGSDPVREAISLRDAGDLPGALRLLSARVAARPSDGEAMRLLAQTLYWSKDLDSARSTYRHALELHPEDVQLRLEYARMLVETRDDSGARAILAPLADSPPARARAETLLGTLAYWEGDFSGATGHFRAALKADPTAAEARRQWREIAALTAPWVRLELEAGHDDQPLDRAAPTIAAGWFVTPLWSFDVRGRPAWYRLGDATTRSVPAGEAMLRGYSPALRLETELAGGMVRRSNPGSTTDWTGRVAARLRLGGPAAVGARIERTPYLNTVASLGTRVMVREIVGLFTLNDPHGWLGEASYGQQHFPDSNTITSGYAWVLAPLTWKRAVALQIGYAFSAQNSLETRFTLADTAHAPGDPRVSPAGHYTPYFTPDHFISHSAIAAVTLGPSPATTLTANGSVAIHARDDVPSFRVTGAPPAVALVIVRRAVTPWKVRLGFQRTLSHAVTVAANAEHNRTVFYSATTVGLQFTWRFETAAARRVDHF